MESLRVAISQSARLLTLHSWSFEGRGRVGNVNEIAGRGTISEEVAQAKIVENISAIADVEEATDVGLLVAA